MTTQTAQRGPAGQPFSEADIRQAMVESIGDGFVEMDDVVDLLRVAIDSDHARVRMPWDEDYSPPQDHPGTLWADLRPEEAEELHETMWRLLIQVEHEATTMLIERATAAAVAFSAAHPDIPRGHWPLRVRAEAA